jgi:hydrogenase assembly chaperone HypC/HupF
MFICIVSLPVKWGQASLLPRPKPTESGGFDAVPPHKQIYATATNYRGNKCLGVPGEVIAVDGLRATVDFWGVEKEVRLDTVDAPVEPGDYVLNHVGCSRRHRAESVRKYRIVVIYRFTSFQ